mmetsp:Transcript_1120/g.3278  ORF Transcript_1120/g.3278 Transcript_1120/m.3278 type:complete len:388 (+) Transcript_1120:262-1425(+)
MGRHFGLLHFPGNQRLQGLAKLNFNLCSEGEVGQGLERVRQGVQREEPRDGGGGHESPPRLSKLTLRLNPWQKSGNRRGRQVAEGEATVLLQERFRELPLENAGNLCGFQALCSLAGARAHGKDQIILPRAGTALDHCLQVRGHKADVEGRVQPVLRNEDRSVRVLRVQAQLSRNEVDIPRVESDDSRRRELLWIDHTVNLDIPGDAKVQDERIDSSKVRTELDVQTLADSFIDHRRLDGAHLALHALVNQVALRAHAQAFQDCGRRHAFPRLICLADTLGHKVNDALGELGVAAQLGLLQAASNHKLSIKSSRESVLNSQLKPAGIDDNAFAPLDPSSATAHGEKTIYSQEAFPAHLAIKRVHEQGVILDSDGHAKRREGSTQPGA